ncbi:MAG: DUF6531 domain-containing protein [Firmicutes bacterium]|nr:DUF6531 domain-containing protein [Bacillota bacterium]
MSDFMLRYNEIEGIASRVRVAGDMLNTSASQLRREANRLNGQQGFGISNIQFFINECARAAELRRDDANATAEFLATLKDSVVTHENLAWQELAGNLPQGLTLSMLEGAAAMFMQILDNIRNWASNLLAGITGGPQWCVSGLDPINLATGNFYYSKEDISIPGRYSLGFTRFYNAIIEYDSTIGKNWTHNFNICLVKSENLVHITFDDGHVETYTRKEDGTYTSPAGRSNVLTAVKNDEVSYCLTLQSMDKYHFNKNGALTCIADTNGNKIQLEYYENLLSKVSSDSGSLNFTYGEDGYIAGVSDHVGRQVTFKYNDGKLVEVVHPTGASYEYEYDLKGNMVKIINPLGIDVVRNEYDPSGRTTIQHMADGGVAYLEYDNDRLSTTVTEQNGNKIEYLRDDKYRSIKNIYADSEESFEYDEDNNRTKYVDRNKNTWQYKYDGHKNMTSSTDPLGNNTAIEYNELNRPVRIINPAGAVTVLEYDSCGNMLGITDPLGRKTGFVCDEQGKVTTFTMPDGSESIIEYDKRGNITKIKDGTGIVTKYRYDKLNRVISTIDGNSNETHYKYDKAGNILEVKNAAGDIRAYSYNKLNKVTSITDFDSGRIRYEYNALNRPSKLIDQLGRETVLNYDIMWNLAEVIEPNGAETKFVYNGLNRLECVQKPDGSTVRYQYDANGNRTGIIDEAGNKTNLSYNANGQLVEVTDPEGGQMRYTYNSIGQVTSVTDAIENTVYLSYDAAGQLVEEKSPLGDCRKYTYTPLGKISTVTDESGLETRYEYELGGRLKAVHYPDGNTEHCSYDKGGNLQVYTTRTGQILSYEYDSLNRIVTITDSAGAAKHYTYDAVSNVTSMTDENGHKTVYEYTATGQLSKVTDALGNQTAYTYDERDRLIEVRQGEAGQLGPDADLEKANHITRYSRNLMGQVEEITDALGQKESFRYDVRGQLIEKVDKDGYLTKYGYTTHGDVGQIQYADGREVKLSYNPLRQLIEVEDWLGLTQIEMDELGRTTKVINHQNQAVEYTWGNSGERRGMTYPSGKQVNYEYDAFLRLSKVDDGDMQATYQYDNHSRLVEKVFSNGAKTQYQYNDLGRLRELSHWNADGLQDKYLYEYDQMGNKTGITKERRGLPEESGVYSYAYDSLNRLHKVSKDGNLLRGYEYDGFGNRIQMTAGEMRTSYSYNALNQLVSTVDTAGMQQKYSYDRRGNLTEVHKNGALANKYHFGALNRLEKAINHETGLEAVYRYNGLGHRVGKSTGLNPTKQIDDVLDLTKQYFNLLERDGTDYVWDNNILFASGISGNEEYLLDDLGSPSRVRQDAYGYDEFGNMLYDSSTGDTQPFGFTGYQWDAVAGTWYAQAREYDAYTGRFVSEDLVKGFIEAPFTLNQYAYCWNNPMNLVDLNGLWPQWVRDAGNVVIDAANTVGNRIIDGVNTVADVATNLVQDVRNFDFNNSCPQVTLDSNFFSIYRGQLVIRAPLPNGSSASFGIMILNPNENRTYIVQHERAHLDQLRELGLLTYIRGIAIPSVISSLPFIPLEHHRMPWEVSADMGAGISHPNITPTDNEIALANLYWSFLTTVSHFDISRYLLRILIPHSSEFDSVVLPYEDTK